MKERQIKTFMTVGKATIEIVIDTDKKYKPKTEGHNWGYIEVAPIDISTTKETCFWDNIDFFAEASVKELIKECKGDLKYLGIYDKDILKEIKKEVKRIKKLGFLR